MSRKNKTPLSIFAESLKLYFTNFKDFVKYMSFPVLGQVGGLILIFLLASFFAKNISIVIEKVPALNDELLIFGLLVLIVLPGLIVFMRAFWEYLVAYGAINSMLENLLKSGRVYDYDAHTELIKRRAFSFVGLWFLVGIFSLISVIPFFWVPCAVLAIYFVLIFQVFTYEPELSTIACVKKSMQLVKGHFASTFMLIALIGALTYILLPQIINTLLEYTNISKFISGLILPAVQALPIENWNSLLSYLYLQPLKSDVLANFIITSFVAQIFIQYTLPMRSILCGMWYRHLNSGNFGNKTYADNKKSKKKRPSEKLMEATNKKYSTKKLDRNILKRAMEKDSD